MIRLGTIGTSWICQSFLGGAELTGEYEISAVYSRNYGTGAAFAADFGCTKVFTDIEKMAEYDGLDAVYIASPNVFHAEQSRIFLEHGKHVISEKPIVTRLSDYEKNVRIAEENGLVYMEAMIPIHTAGYGKVKEALSSIGKIKEARIDYSQRSSRFDAFCRGERVNIFDMALHAGAFMDLGVYCVHGAVDLFGLPEGIEATAKLLHNGADGAGKITFDYGGFTANLSYSKTEDGNLGSDIIGENGRLHIDMISQYAGATLFSDGKETKITGHDTKEEQMRGEAQSFADFILHPEDNKKKYEGIKKLCFDVCETMEKTRAKLGIELKFD